MDISFTSILFISVVVTVSGDETDIYAKLKDIENIVKQQGIRIRELEGTVEKLEGTITDQQIKIDKLNHLVETFQDDVKDSAVKTDNITNNDAYVAKVKSDNDLHVVKDQKRDNRERRLLVGNGQILPSSGAVAFYAYISKSENHVGSHQSLIFDVVKTNIGNGYNSHTGAFLAPKSGIYAFLCTFFPNRLSSASVHMLKNNEIYTTIYGEMSTQGILSGSTGFIVVSLNVGDDIIVRTSSTSVPTGGIRSDGYVRTSFAGWKIADYE